MWAVKSQIHAGGRGKGRFKEPEAGEKGGVRIAKAAEEVGLFAEQMLGRTLVTLQTGPAGRVVRRLYIEEGVRIAKEFYLSVLVDRESGRVAFVASEAGGMNIEEVAHDTPEKITNVPIDPTDRPDARRCREDRARVRRQRRAGRAMRRPGEQALRSVRQERHELA